MSPSTRALTPAIARVLAARGLHDAAVIADFLDPRLEGTFSPWQLRGMEEACTRILAAIAAGERIRICGDYDADGITAVAILRQALGALGARVDSHLPHRLADGYGLSCEAIERAHADDVRLLITVDNGIREFEALRRARALGLEAIVTDHHLAAPDLPPACAILNPNQPDCAYPNKALTGAGVAFKLVQALLERAGEIAPGAWPERLRAYLKLVAIGTIADAATLLGENRALVAFGLAGLANARNPGLRALLRLALEDRADAGVPLRAHDVAFRVAPRLNAAGRMGSPDTALELFFAPPAQASQLALELETMNQRRREAGAELVRQIDAAAPPGAEEAVAVFAGEGWHRGVLGIAATQLLQRDHRAVVLASIDAATQRAHGSARAPAGAHLLALFDSCQDLFADGDDGGERIRYGGHAQALGFCLPAQRLDELRQRLNQAARDAGWQAAPAPAPIQPDAAITLAEIDAGFMADLRRLEPFGTGNLEPLFAARGVRLAAAPQILKELHLKLRIAQGGSEFDALWWRAFQSPSRAAELRDLAPGDRLDLEFRVEASSHPRFGDRVQLILQGLRRSAAAGA